MNSSSVSIRPVTAPKLPSSFHVVPTVKGAGYFPGTGIVMPGHPAPKPGFFVNVMVNPAAKLSAKVKVDEAKRAITITVDATVSHLTLPADAAKRIDIPGSPGHLGHYSVVVKSTSGKVLYRGSTENYLPM